jgi:4-amino-4-deoxy-L-arabinose transferase-like glycosyltransferase
MKSKQRTVIFLLGLLVVGCWLRVWGIGRNDLWFDEAFTRDLVIHANIVDLLRGEISDLHPPLYFVVLYGWVRLVGDSEIGLRMLSALAAMLALPAYYHLVRLLFNERAGLIALLLGALSPLPIYYGHEVRNYTFGILFGTWTIWGLVAMLRGKRYGWPLYTLAALGGLYSHYFNGLMLAAVHLWIMAYGPARRQWRRWLSADILIGLLFLPQLSQFLFQSQAVLGSFWISRPNPAAPITTLTFLLFGGTLPQFVGYGAVVVLTVTLTIVTLDVIRRAPPRIRPYWWLCISTIFLVLIGVMVISLIRNPLYLDKSFAVLSPLLLAVLAGGISYARRPSPSPFLAGLLILFMIIGVLNHILVPDPTKPPFRRIAADLLARPAGLDTPLLMLHDSTPFSLGYYAPDLIKQMRIVHLQEKGWLYPQSAIYPQTWRVFGYERYSREEIANWLRDYSGRLRVVATANTEPPEQQTLAALRQKACTESITDYPPFVVIFDFQLGNCLISDKRR